MLARSGHDPLVARRLFRMWWHRNGRRFAAIAAHWNAFVIICSALVAQGAPAGAWIGFGAIATTSAFRLWIHFRQPPAYMLPGPDLEPPKPLPAPLPPAAERLVQEAVQRHYEAEVARPRNSDDVMEAQQAFDRFKMEQMQAQSNARSNLSQRMVDMRNTHAEISRYIQLDMKEAASAAIERANNPHPDSMYADTHNVRPASLKDPGFGSTSEKLFGRELSEAEYNELLKRPGLIK